ncbi:MAG: type II toxin-antitoxin system HicB family antitoxin [Geobacter sp.]|nr:type II toxin-antitoxin system HicB family antitoxin [Geobacter sp.]
MPRKKYHFAILIEQDEDGIYVATVPALPGCHTQAKNLADLDERVKEAIALCLDVERDKKRIPQNTFVGVHQLEMAV